MRPRLAPALAALLLGVLFLVNVYRAHTQSVTVDEAFTYTRFVAPPLSAWYSFYDANNHVLNSLAARVSTALAGPTELGLRVPSLLGGLLYLVGVFLVSRRLFGSGGWFLLAVALNSLNPLLLDYLSAARGYGLGLAFWSWALYVILRQPGAASWRAPAFSGALMGLAVLSNLVMLVPCAALGVAAWSRLRNAAIQIAAAAAVAAPPLVFALHSARRANFFHGAATAKDAIYTLAESSFFYGATFLNAHVSDRGILRDLLYWAFLGGVLALVILLVRDARAEARWDRARNIIATSLILAVVFQVVLRKVFGVLYPGGRTGLYFIPLVTWAAVILLARLNGSGLVRRAATATGLVAAAAVLIQYALQFNTSYYYEIRFDAGTRRLVERLVRIQAGTHAPRLSLGVTPFLKQSIEFYRQTWKLPWLEPAGFDGPTCLFDYYALLAQDRDSFFRKYRLTELLYDETSGAILAKPLPRAFPEVEALRQAGFRDPIPCGVDFDRLTSAIEMSRPESQAHWLRDVVGAPGPGGSVWMAARPALIFHLPDASHRELELDLHIHEIVLAPAGAQTLTLRVNGRELDRVTYASKGRRVYRRVVPAAWLGSGGITVLEIESSHWWVSPDDGQKLGFLLSRAGWRPRR